ncbi:Meiotically up-regulated gene 157 protein [Yarrowia sp. C11]|nr:Meiotically up-regulated gene 157 protein [Yarrowia sp. C11]KAG5370507.1 Meiotically up-regulated gene 157 protein [Yarrowia sp. E02]
MPVSWYKRPKFMLALVLWLAVSVFVLNALVRLGDHPLLINTPDAKGEDIPDVVEPKRRPIQTEDREFEDAWKARESCPAYEPYSKTTHEPLSEGPLKLPFMRPSEKCRTFHSDEVEKTIEEYKQKMADPDLARLFENAFPNTLDTTIRWHRRQSEDASAQTFVVTGDINAEWLRDSAWQLSAYKQFISTDTKIQQLYKGAINTQASYIEQFPYCNAFQPPKVSRIKPQFNAGGDKVKPKVDPTVVFECKYELDSLASFLTLSNDYYDQIKDNLDEVKDTFAGNDGTWYRAFAKLSRVLEDQSQPTFSEDGSIIGTQYSFKRNTDLGTETLNLQGMGNPVADGTGLVRSAFRPSDDATIFQFFVPANAHISVELKRVSKIFAALGRDEMSKEVLDWGTNIAESIWKYAVYDHPKFGKVFAYEIDGFGAITNMDDANIPSLLSLPVLGFLDKDNEVYKNTRKMILSKQGNPYYLTGKAFSGIGGPHVGIKNAWPMSRTMMIRTAETDEEIVESLNMLKTTTSGLGLMHESIDVTDSTKFSRPWFAWCNSEFAKAIMYLAEHKPELIFKKD